MKKHISGLHTGYTLAFYLFTGIACASDRFENTLNPLFSSGPASNDNLFTPDPHPYNYNLNPIDSDPFDLNPWQNKTRFAPKASGALDTAENIPALNPDCSNEITADETQAPPTPTPIQKHTCTVPGCGYTADWASYITIHTYYHADERPFKCTKPGCTYGAKTQSDLTKHMCGHAEDKQFKCTKLDCPYTTKWRAAWVTHMHGHTGERPYKCLELNCIYAATTQSNLTRHRRYKHAGEQQFKCSELDCPYFATRQSSLTRHIQYKHAGEQPAKRQRSRIEMTELLNPPLLPE